MPLLISRRPEDFSAPEEKPSCRIQEGSFRLAFSSDRGSRGTVKGWGRQKSVRLGEIVDSQTISAREMRRPGI